MQAATAEPHDDRVDYIDGLRALAIVVVVARHYYMAVYQPGLPRWFDLLAFGYVGVHLFLLLSGLCIGWAFVGPKAKPLVLKPFALRRVTRILPAYYAALAIAFVLSWPMSAGEAAKQLLTHLTMSHNFLPSTVLALNGTFWSLALEMQLYLLFPFMHRAARAWGWPTTVAAVFGAQLLYRIALLRFGTDYTDLTFVLPWGVFGRMGEFALGVWLAHLIRSRTVSVKVASTALAFVPIFAVLAQAGKKAFGVTHPLTDGAWTLAFAGLILAAARGPAWVRKAFEIRPLVHIGQASYSVYLVHSLFLGALVALTVGQAPGSVRVALCVPMVLGVVLLCFPFYWLIEKPSIRWGRAWTERLSRKPAA